MPENFIEAPESYFCCTALSSFNRIYWLQNQREPILLEWNSHTNSFHSSGIKAKKYWTSIFNTYIFCTLGIASSVLVITNPFKNPQVHPALVVSAIFVMSCGCLVLASETIILKYYGFIIQGFESVGSLVKGIRKDSQSMDPGPTSIFRGPFGTTCGPTFWKSVCRILIFCEISFQFFIVTVPTIGATVKVEPFHITIPMIFPIFNENKVLLTFMCSVLGLICFNEACRLYAFYLPKLVYLIELHFSILRGLNRIPLKQPKMFLKWYRAFQVWESAFDGYIGSMVGTLLGCGFVIFIVSNVGTLKYYSMLPLPVYLINPFVSFLVFAITFVTLPFAVHLEETTRKFVWQRKTQFRLQLREAWGNLEGEFMAKKFSCLRPVTFSCGGFYPLHRGAETDFYMYVTLRTTDLLLTMENLGVFSNF